MKSLISTYKNWQRRAQQRRQLAGLSQMQLKDMGFTQSDVINEIRKKRWEK